MFPHLVGSPFHDISICHIQNSKYVLLYIHVHIHIFDRLMYIWNFYQTKHRTLAVHICNLDWWGGIIILVLRREEIQAGRLKASRGPGTRKSSTFQINPTCSKGNPVKPNFFQAFNLRWAARFRSSTAAMVLQHILFGDFLNVREVVRSFSLSLSLLWHLSRLRVSEIPRF